MKNPRVAIIQHPPVFLNLNESVEKARQLIVEAANDGANIICFPETWLPGYPIWLDVCPGAGLWDHPPAKSLFSLLYDNSVELGDAHLERLADAAVRHNCFIIMGAHERQGGTLYNTIFYFAPEQGLAGIHRKLMPTYTERLIWGRGDGSTLTFLETEFGNLGGLICWEHWMPLARAAMHARGEAIHIAQWPMVKEMNLIASRHYAFEGQCFVLAAGATLTRGELLDGLPSRHPHTTAALELLNEIPGDADTLLLRGGSAIIGPDGSFIQNPVQDKPMIITADLDLNLISGSRLFLDTDGHYSRPDVFELTVNERPQIGVNFNKK